MITMKRLYFLFLLFCYTETKKTDPDKERFCKEVEDQCQSDDVNVCGVRWEGKRFRLKIFLDECELIKYGCRVEEQHAYGIINMKYCNETISIENNGTEGNIIESARVECIKDCPPRIGNETLCAIRRQGEGFKVRLFINECEMMKYNCKNNLMFDPTDNFICNGLVLPVKSTTDEENKRIGTESERLECIKDCPPQIGNETLCGIRKQGEGFKVRLFVNECEMMKYNCKNNLMFEPTDHFICNGLILPVKSIGDDEANTTVPSSVPPRPLEFYGDNGVQSAKSRRKNVVIVDADMFDNSGNINDTIDSFFAGTHVFDMPLKDISHSMNESTRRVMLRIFGPTVVFKPLVEIPKTISTGPWYDPMLNSCYHKCPKKCPDTYAPVCGNAGMSSREPKLMFQNHCMMDAAQCKMRIEDKSYTAASSNYIESTFIFCVGLKLYGLYRFLPLIRTLQHMGRLKKKGNYHTRLRNLRHFNELLQESPRLMG